jgi:hypothetical protein
MYLLAVKQDLLSIVFTVFWYQSRTTPTIQATTSAPVHPILESLMDPAAPSSLIGSDEFPALLADEFCWPGSEESNELTGLETPFAGVTGREAVVAAPPGADSASSPESGEVVDLTAGASLGAATTGAVAADPEESSLDAPPAGGHSITILGILSPACSKSFKAAFMGGPAVFRAVMPVFRSETPCLTCPNFAVKEEISGSFGSFARPPAAPFSFPKSPLMTPAIPFLGASLGVAGSAGVVLSDDDGSVGVAGVDGTSGAEESEPSAEPAGASEESEDEPGSTGAAGAEGAAPAGADTTGTAGAEGAADVPIEGIAPIPGSILVSKFIGISNCDAHLVDISSSYLLVAHNVLAYELDELQHSEVGGQELLSWGRFVAPARRLKRPINTSL